MPSLFAENCHYTSFASEMSLSENTSGLLHFGAIWHLLTITAISSKTLEVTRYGADHKQHHFNYLWTYLSKWLIENAHDKKGPIEILPTHMR